MTTQHTPGPWKVTKNPHTRLVFLNAGNRDYPLFKDDADGLDTTNADWSNAEFIVRACNAHDDLLEALEALMRAEGLTDDDYYETIDGAMALARLAIAKAKGETQ